LFLHIVGALGFFVTLGLEWTGLLQIKNATLPGQGLAWTGILKSKGVGGVGFVSMLTMLLTGIYMIVRVWGGVPWVIVTIGALALEIVLFVAVTGPRMAALERALGTEKGPLSQTFHTLANHPLLWISMQARVAIALGIVFLKTAKPDLTGSLLTIGVAIVIGLASALPMVRTEQPREKLAD
jgi:hypothetical protein